MLTPDIPNADATPPREDRAGSRQAGGRRTPSQGHAAIGRDGRVIYVNGTFARLTGLRAEDVVGTTEESLDALLESVCDPHRPYPSFSGSAWPLEQNPAHPLGREAVLHLAASPRIPLSRSVRHLAGDFKIVGLKLIDESETTGTAA